MLGINKTIRPFVRNGRSAHQPVILDRLPFLIIRTGFAKGEALWDVARRQVEQQSGRLYAKAVSLEQALVRKSSRWASAFRQSYRFADETASALAAYVESLGPEEDADIARRRGWIGLLFVNRCAFNISKRWVGQ